MNTMDAIGNIDTRWFQDRLADKRLSQRKLASVMNLDPAAVSLMFRGKRKMSAAEAAEVSRILNVDVDEVLRRAGIYAVAGQARDKAMVAMGEAHDAERAIHEAKKALLPPLTAEEVAEQKRLARERTIEDRKAQLAHIEHELERLDPEYAAQKAAQAQQPPASDMFEVPVPLAAGGIAKLLLPRQLTKADAERIAALVSAFVSK